MLHRNWWSNDSPVHLTASASHEHSITALVSHHSFHTWITSSHQLHVDNAAGATPFGPLKGGSEQGLPASRPCKLLLCGEEWSGQGQVAGALLKLMQGVQVHTVSLPVLVMGGSGDAAAGLVQLLEEAVRR